MELLTGFILFNGHRPHDLTFYAGNRKKREERCLKDEEVS
jgi:hypothetical protein